MDMDRVKVCEHCGQEYTKGRVSNDQWAKRRFCSPKCKASMVRGKSAIRPEEAILRDLYESQRLTVRQIGDRYGVPHISVLRWLKFYGIERRDAHNGLLNRGITPPTADELHHMIHVEKLTYEEVAAKFGVDFTAVPYWLKKHGIALSQNPGIFQCSRYVASDGQVVKSSYEKTVSDWLFARSITYRYEPRLLSTRYRADFLANGWYIEVWGVEKFDSYEQRRMAKRRIYEANDLPLIELIPKHFSTRINTFNKLMSRCLAPPDDLPLFRSRG